jgi:hypothetical protein
MGREKGMRTNDDEEEEEKNGCLIFSLTANQLHDTTPRRTEKQLLYLSPSLSIHRICMYVRWRMSQPIGKIIR